MNPKKLTPALASAAALVLVAAPAPAAGSVVVSINGDSSGTVYPYTAISKGSVEVGAGDVTCSGLTFSGDINTGTNSTEVADVTAATWTDCSDDTIPVTVTATFPPYWVFNVTNVVSPTEVDGTLNDVSAHVDIFGPLGDCSSDVTGSVGVTFDANEGGKQELTVNSSQLTISNVDNVVTCLGLVNNDDPAFLTGSYNVTVHDPATGDPIPGTPLSIT